ncbi:cytochrome b N-terminal domain-containing protein [Desulfosediminicola ganghwensis]|uniref:cytochrome b N-terminal domain-containing protein n=1 Tax=Desulfosediminicola ganghwensis TaxID=2569540 RepID=UPI00142F188F|nr:cytochrome b N-terminal domain-containing protein [Desulfosediminicola ganghwensis]
MTAGSREKQVTDGVLSQFVLHLHPKRVPEETLRFTLSFGLGGISLTLLVLLGISGAMQLMSYEPTVQHAHDTVRAMYGDSNISGWFRNIHYWSSNLLIVSMGLHLLRVLCTDALTGGRRLNWVVGTFMLLLVLLICFTGYLLPWSQLSYWAVTIFINMAGYIPVVGEVLTAPFRTGGTAVEVGQGTLSTFFVLHTGWLPLTLSALVLLHIWLIRKAGGLVTKDAESRNRRVAVKPALIVREAAVGLVATALIFLLASFFDAPAGEPAMVGVSPNPVKAAWYFMGVQEMLIHFRPVFAVCVFPALTCIAFISLPFWQQRLESPGTWFGGRRGRKLALVAAIGGAFAATILVAYDAIGGLDGNGTEVPAMALVSRGWFSLVLLGVGLGAGFLLLTRKKHYLKGEVILAAWMAVFAWMVTLTITGIWFRGPGMQLLFPS